MKRFVCDEKYENIIQELERRGWTRVLEEDRDKQQSVNPLSPSLPSSPLPSLISPPTIPFSSSLSSSESILKSDPAVSNSRDPLESGVISSALSIGSSVSKYDLLWKNLTKIKFQTIFNRYVNHFKGSSHLSNKVSGCDRN